MAEADAKAVIAAVKGFTPTIVNALTNIIAKKPSFVSLIVAVSLVKQDLASLNSATTAFENALKALAPVCSACSALSSPVADDSGLLD